jgi:polar amino acid transport system permease protein
VTDQPLIPVVEETIPDSEIEDKQRKGLSDLPWWLFAIFLIAIGTGIIIFTNDNYSEAFGFIKAGIQLTITTSLFAYLIAIVLGLLAGLGRISKNIVLNNLARLYVELIRGIPMLVLIFFIALVGVPTAIDGMNNLGRWLSGRGLEGIGNILLLLDNQNISQHVRAIVALAVTYGAFLAEIFRAGIQSIGRGQMEASRSLGMNYAQAMRYIILPQAVRNVLPALGNDFVAMVKDSSLISLLGVRDITQLAKVYSGRTFRFREAYITLSVLYLTMTVSLSLLIQVVERRLRKNE